jgi:hypothetical protein
VGFKAASAPVSAKFGISDLLLVLFILHGFRENQCKEDNVFLKSVNEITLIFYGKTLRHFENKEHWKIVFTASRNTHLGLSKISMLIRKLQIIKP